MYKNLTFIIFAIIISSTLKAQTQKGDQLLGGGLGFGITNDKSDYTNYNNSDYNFNSKSKNVSFSIGPSYSYLINDNLDLGVNLGYGTEKTIYNYSVSNSNVNVLPSNYNSKNYFAGVYLRKYFLYNKKIGIRTGPFVEYQKYKSLYEYLSPQSNNNFLQIGNLINTGLILDFVYFPTKKIGIISTLGSLGYVYSDNKSETLSNNNHDLIDSFGFRFISALNLSIVYRFGKYSVLN